MDKKTVFYFLANKFFYFINIKKRWIMIEIIENLIENELYDSAEMLIFSDLNCNDEKLFLLLLKCMFLKKKYSRFLYYIEKFEFKDKGLFKKLNMKEKNDFIYYYINCLVEMDDLYTATRIYKQYGMTIETLTLKNLNLICTCFKQAYNIHEYIESVFILLKRNPNAIDYAFDVANYTTYANSNRLSKFFSDLALQTKESCNYVSQVYVSLAKRAKFNYTDALIVLLEQNDTENLLTHISPNKKNLQSPALIDGQEDFPFTPELSPFSIRSHPSTNARSVSTWKSPNNSTIQQGAFNQLDVDGLTPDKLNYLENSFGNSLSGSLNNTLGNTLGNSLGNSFEETPVGANSLDNSISHFMSIDSPNSKDQIRTNVILKSPSHQRGGLPLFGSVGQSLNSSMSFAGTNSFVPLSPTSKDDVESKLELKKPEALRSKSRSENKGGVTPLMFDSEIIPNIPLLSQVARLFVRVCDDQSALAIYKKVFLFDPHFESHFLCYLRLLYEYEQNELHIVTQQVLSKQMNVNNALCLIALQLSMNVLQETKQVEALEAKINKLPEYIIRNPEFLCTRSLVSLPQEMFLQNLCQYSSDLDYSLQYARSLHKSQAQRLLKTLLNSIEKYHCDTAVALIYVTFYLSEKCNPSVVSNKELQRIVDLCDKGQMLLAKEQQRVNVASKGLFSGVSSKLGDLSIFVRSRYYYLQRNPDAAIKLLSRHGLSFKDSHIDDLFARCYSLKGNNPALVIEHFTRCQIET
eukprot:TRINITY_DN2075_c0_g1_i1.p1 TRINITY_DN2075_c0_g1~~TRINITY_DN2075_c0_g1_i1.p1  ORF type:complete len:748 (-),score=180.95 TRINITY_DN2075_c0_g1_i1:3-2246(-)